MCVGGEKEKKMIDGFVGARGQLKWRSEMPEGSTEVKSSGGIEFCRKH